MLSIPFIFYSVYSKYINLYKQTFIHAKNDVTRMSSCMYERTLKHSNHKYGREGSQQEKTIEKVLTNQNSLSYTEYFSLTNCTATIATSIRVMNFSFLTNFQALVQKL